MNKILSDFRTKGMVGKSSRFLINKMISNIDFSKDLQIIQYGSGKAVFVREILKRMTKNSKLFVFEVNKDCNKYVQNISDDRLFYINDGAENIGNYITFQVDAIVSTLPFASLPNTLLEPIILTSKNILKDGGLFLQYQYFLTNKKQIEKIFGKKCELSFEFVNFPPAFIYKIRK